MSRLIEITEELRDLHAELARLETTLAKHPTSESLSVDFHSLSKRRSRLESEFNELASSIELDVVRYRLEPAHGRSVPLRALTKALDRFQATVATIFDALKTGPKQRAKLTADTYAAAGFDFGYTYSGSLGVVLTVPNERMLLDGSDLDYSIGAFFDAAHSESRDEVIQFARKYGIPAVRRLYEWSAAHADFDIAADIRITRGPDARARLQVAPKSLRKLKSIIEETSETTDEPFEISGRLAGLDTEKRTFHLVAVGGEDIEGEWGERFVYDPRYLLDQTYGTSLIKRTKVHYALEKEDVIWLLVELRPKTDFPAINA